MKNFILIIFLNLFGSPAFSKNSYDFLIKKAASFYHSKEYKSSLKYYQKAFKVHVGTAKDLYNAACCAALTGGTRTAFSLLSKALNAGWLNISHLKKDQDLISLQGSKKWETLINEMQVRLDEIEIHYDKPLQKELLEILDRDQKARNEYIKAFDNFGRPHRTTDSLAKIMMYQDSLNLIRITKILDEQGWISRSKVGDKAAQAPFLVIQHSELNIQEKYYPLVKKAVANGELQASHLALLEDRMSLRKGLRQKFGSQIYYNRETKKHYIAPLEDPDNVDQRRLEVGLGLLADYVKKWNIDWVVEKYKLELPELEKLNKINKK